MAWKVVTFLALFALSEARPPTSEQRVKIENQLSHIGSRIPESQGVYAVAYPSYEFSYEVSDPHTHDFKGHHEQRKGDEVKGYYWLIQPDGLKRTVKYRGDKHSGLKAHVLYTKPWNENKNEIIVDENTADENLDNGRNENSREDESTIRNENETEGREENEGDSNRGEEQEENRGGEEERQGEGDGEREAEENNGEAQTEEENVEIQEIESGALDIYRENQERRNSNENRGRDLRGRKENRNLGPENRNRGRENQLRRNNNEDRINDEGAQGRGNEARNRETERGQGRSQGRGGRSRGGREEREGRIEKATTGIWQPSLRGQRRRNVEVRRIEKQTENRRENIGRGDQKERDNRSKENNENGQRNEENQEERNQRNEESVRKSGEIFKSEYHVVIYHPKHTKL